MAGEQSVERLRSNEIQLGWYLLMAAKDSQGQQQGVKESGERKKLLSGSGSEGVSFRVLDANSRGRDGIRDS